MEIGGTVDRGFERLREAFADGQARDPGGAQLCIYRDGRKVADLWTGMDRANDRAFTGDLVTILMSCTKGATAIATHMLAERGLVEYDAPVARYWPEFAAGGKAKLTLRDVLSHRAGLMALEEGALPKDADIWAWQPVVEALARMEPLWEPGTAYFYHFTTFGYLLGEVIRRVSGMTSGQFLAKNIAQPLGLDLWVGLPDAIEPRVAPTILSERRMTDEQWRAYFTGLGIDLDTRLMRTILFAFAAMDAAHPMINSRACRAAELPASNGVGNARALARMYAACIGDIDGVRLLRRETMKRARECQTEELTAPIPQLAGPTPQRFGLGFELPRVIVPMLGPGSFGHAGAGGRLGFADPESGIAAGYVCTSMMWDGATGPDRRWLPWTNALHEILAR